MVVKNSKVGTLDNQILVLPLGKWLPQCYEKGFTNSNMGLSDSFANRARVLQNFIQRLKHDGGTLVDTKSSVYGLKMARRLPLLIAEGAKLSNRCTLRSPICSFLDLITGFLHCHIPNRSCLGMGRHFCIFTIANNIR